MKGANTFSHHCILKQGRLAMYIKAWWITLCRAVAFLLWVLTPVFQCPALTCQAETWLSRNQWSWGYPGTGLKKYWSTSQPRSNTARTRPRLAEYKQYPWGQRAAPSEREYEYGACLAQPLWTLALGCPGGGRRRYWQEWEILLGFFMLHTAPGLTHLLIIPMKISPENDFL